MINSSLFLFFYTSAKLRLSTRWRNFVKKPRLQSTRWVICYYHSIVGDLWIASQDCNLPNRVWRDIFHRWLEDNFSELVTGVKAIRTSIRKVIGSTGTLGHFSEDSKTTSYSCRTVNVSHLFLAKTAILISRNRKLESHQFLDLTIFVSFLQLIVWRNRNSCGVWGGEEPPVSALLYFGFSCHVGPTDPWIWTFKKSSLFITEETIMDITVYCSPEARFLVFLKSVFPCLFNRRTLAPENDPLCPHSMLKLLSWAVLSDVLWLLGNGWRNNWKCR